MDLDRTNEINKLSVMSFRGVTEAALEPSDKLVLVLIEERLLEKIPKSEFNSRDLRERLARYKMDLENEGFATRFVECDIYAGTKHQDGQTLLAIRRFLKDVKASWNLEGVVLVGSFPEATIVRRWIWERKNWDVKIAGRDYRGDNRRDYLRIVPEAVAPRADIVLADLDGDWEDIYVKEKKEIQSIEALPAEGYSILPKDGIFESTRFNDSKITFEDFFWLKEDDFNRQKAGKGVLRLKFDSADLQNPEVSPTEMRNPNPLSIPDIRVSRINAKHVAVMPNAIFGDRNGIRFLDSEGKPQVVNIAKKMQPKRYLKKNLTFERELLIDYFDRNHAFRTGDDGGRHRTAAVNYGNGLATAKVLNQYLGKASPDFEAPVDFNNASLLNYVEFLKSPAVLKGFSAHSNKWNTSYGAKYDVSELEKLVGGKPWRWYEEKVGDVYRYTPSLLDQRGSADAYLHRTIYENGILKDTGASLYIHIGCEVNTPGNALSVPYNHPDYGTAEGFQNAESILFFLNGVALASRSKVFYDKPRGFTEAIGKDPQNRFGDGWIAYFQVESEDRDLNKDVAGNKRTYPWSIIGDWTLRLR